jgi:hypothetical protein
MDCSEIRNPFLIHIDLPVSQTGLAGHVACALVFSPVRISAPFQDSCCRVGLFVLHPVGLHTLYRRGKYGFQCEQTQVFKDGSRQYCRVDD